MTPAAQGLICGFGPKGYELAIEPWLTCLPRLQAAQAPNARIAKHAGRTGQEGTDAIEARPALTSEGNWKACLMKGCSNFYEKDGSFR